MIEIYKYKNALVFVDDNSNVLYDFKSSTGRGVRFTLRPFFPDLPAYATFNELGGKAYPKLEDVQWFTEVLTDSFNDVANDAVASTKKNVNSAYKEFLDSFKI